MLFYRLAAIRTIGMLIFLIGAAACSANAAQPSPGELLTPQPSIQATDPLATFWLPTSAASGTPAPAPGAKDLPPAGVGATPLPGDEAEGPQAPLPTAAGPAAPQSSGTPAGAGLSSDLPPAVETAREWIAGQLRLVESDVVLQNVERVNWPDTCLGVGQPGQGCAQVTTPGYRILFYANGLSYEVRVNETGSVLRLLEGGKG